MDVFEACTHVPLETCRADVSERLARLGYTFESLNELLYHEKQAVATAVFQELQTSVTRVAKLVFYHEGRIRTMAREQEELQSRAREMGEQLRFMSRQILQPVIQGGPRMNSADLVQKNASLARTMVVLRREKAMMEERVNQLQQAARYEHGILYQLREACTRLLAAVRSVGPILISFPEFVEWLDWFESRPSFTELL